ncbi:hypothetical protein FAZ19_11765 [Sphingobacterium alkalisoli]|uniref:Uncharacterized protein n=1 Tax=Sphingobacterium alkalisoli TaxID=1874115 RepID=A0A4V5LYA2_9SPHI|nr:hypothetical protein [Sphingobacterium alkalisoli]TJY65789.1 hypothetical protein FAZ19_11765 [Sphingobacterium alkalisoli]GGH18305.1 hypothetical protein GCM10011418_21850 [Sphingobacterium alkalisoli]
MDISKELIAKYHQGRCSEQEKAQVEAWLNTDSDEVLSAPLEIADKNAIKEDIWGSLKAETIEKEPREKTVITFINNLRLRSTYWGAAAVLVAGFICFWVLDSGKTPYNNQIKNDQTVAGSGIAGVSVVTGENSKANFIDKLELVNFCGTVKVTVNKTMRLAFAAKNSYDNKEYRKELLVNAGETYFALDLGDHKNREIIVKSERDLNDLPPLLQNSLRAQFGI